MEHGDSYWVSFLVKQQWVDAYVTEYDDDDSYLAATVPTCPGLLATGDTLDELIIDLDECYISWQETKDKLNGKTK